MNYEVFEKARQQERCTKSATTISYILMMIIAIYI